ncbi:MAG TPA: hypothetical protein VNU46_07685 [Gemmatimonadaceae bacterium]|nr:hypothetical protein [Gemmatimonadaceae bacterium]
MSITSLQDTMSIGALKYTGTVAIGDSTIQVAVKVKNDSTAAVSYTGGCIRNVGLALYANASLVGSPVVALQQPDPICLALVDGTLVPGDSTVFTGTFPLSQLNKVAAGTYYVAAPLTNVNFDGDSVQVKAGTLLTSN